MGAFILYDSNRKDELDLLSIENVFSDKGFSEPNIFMLGNSELHLYKKQLVDVQNYYIKDDYSIFVIGTIVYKGLSYSDSLKKLLFDFVHNKIEFNRLIGSYCVLFYVKQKLTILNDALNVCDLFTDKKGRFITSSFLAAANATYKLTINRNASLEKLLTGYIVGKDTLFNEIKRIIPLKYRGQWNIYRWPHINIPKADENRSQSITNRINTITAYMNDIEKLAEEYKPELGLSGGYDSRLVYAAAQKAWDFKLDLHTHNTEEVDIHNIEKEIVKEIADQCGSKLNVVPTHNLDYYSGEEIEEILKDGYFYFDGRCAYNMGAFSPTYTRKYKVDTVSGHGLTLNGLGGEVYRNYYMNIKPIVSTKQWMKAKIYPDGVDLIINRDTFNKVHDYICKKMNFYLPFSWKKSISALKIKRYYSEMRMPDCDALNCNANNQMEFYLTPFIEKTMIEDAYKSRKYFGISGVFQAEMINRLSSIVASFNSHYGFPFNKKEPFRHKAYMLVRDVLPDSLWNLRVNKVVVKNFKNNNNKKFFERVEEKCPFLHEASLLTESLFPEINFDYLRTDYAMMPNSSYISIVFYMLRNRIALEC